MEDRIAQAGEMTCIGDECDSSGLYQPDGRQTCADCGATLARMPSAVRDEPRPVPSSRQPDVSSRQAPGIGYAARPAGPQGRSSLSRIVLAFAAAAVVLIISFVIRNPDFLHRFTGAGFAVGDCATVSQTLNGGNMDRTDCSSASQLGDPVYQVASVLDGKDGYCPGGGFDHVTFSNEPESKTYCLVMR